MLKTFVDFFLFTDHRWVDCQGCASQHFDGQRTESRWAIRYCIYDDMTELLISECKNPCHLFPWEISLQTTAKYELPKQVTVNIIVNLSTL